MMRAATASAPPPTGAGVHRRHAALGLTLVEQILASHPLVFGAGELPAFEAAMAEASGPGGSPRKFLEVLPDAPDEMLRRAGAAYVLKGGHLAGDPVDLLFDGAAWREFPAPRISTAHTHGTGCAYSAAVITACLAQGLALPEAVARAKRWIAEAIHTNPGLGRGAGPINHHAAILEMSIFLSL